MTIAPIQPSKASNRYRCMCGDIATYVLIGAPRLTGVEYHCGTCQAAYVLSTVTGDFTGYHNARERYISGTCAGDAYQMRVK